MVIHVTGSGLGINTSLWVLNKMVLKLKDWFTETFLSATGEEPQDEMLQRAAAVLLCEIMHADHEVDAAEQATILQAMQSLLGMTEEDAESLYNEVDVLMKDALSMQQFTSLINEHYAEEKKLELLQWLWRVVYADGRMDAHEEHLLRRISDLLYIRHADFIRIRHLVFEEG